MSYNGSGTFNILNSFVPGTTISSSATNQNNTDIAGGLTNAVTRDGQGAMNAQFKVIPGSEAAPGVAFSSDLDTGMWRVSANTIGFSCNGAEVFELATTGASVIGDLDVSGTITGTFGFGSAILAPDGTVLLPAYSFTNDPTDGIYRIGSHNYGFSINATKLLDLGAAAVGITGALSVSTNATIGGTLGVIGASTLTGAVTMAGGGALTGTFTGTPTFSGNVTFSGTPVFSNPVASKNTAKAFAAFTVSGGVVSFTSGNWYNVASVTRASAGVFDVLFTVAVPTNFSVVCSAEQDGTLRCANVSNKSTAGFQIQVRSNSNVVSDCDGADFQVFGF